ncbi:LCP family protein [Streptomyces sp. MS06]|uniref:LCP family protein n=1 Tax=Streptomyces sp. MS06 TaxID=3385974 RepID=UPI0039A02255
MTQCGLRGERSAGEDGIAGAAAGPSAPAGTGPHDRGAHPAARDRPRRGHRVLRWSAAALAVLVLGTAGGGYLYYRHLNGNIRKDALNLGDRKDRAAAPTANAAGHTPLNILLIGSDGRNSAEDQRLGGAKETFDTPPRADVQMLLHLSADRTDMSVVSMPRDTLVRLPKCTDPDTGEVYPATVSRRMTNESLGRGGPGCTVATWEKLTGIHIDHFVMVDFAGVVSMADAIGGVPVCVDADIYSHTSSGHGSGLRLEKGTTYVKGEQALQWLRTRYGFEDNTDIARAKAQHQYMSAMVRQLRANATLGNPSRLRGLAETATRALTVDEGLGAVKKLYDLSVELNKVPTDRIAMTTMPWVYAADGNRVLPKPGDAEQLFRLVREDIALDGSDGEQGAGGNPEQQDQGSTATASPPAPSASAAPDAEIAVRVRNGTRSGTRAAVNGRAEAVRRLLAGKGFARATVDPSAAPGEETTVVRYPGADLLGDAQRVAGILGLPASAVRQSANVSGITLVVGADWRSGTTYTAPDTGRTGQNGYSTPESADVLNGSDSGCMHVNPDYIW